MRSSFLKFNAVLMLFVLCFAFGSCNKGDKDKPSASDKELTGAGATFPFPLYSKMFDVYSKDKGVKVNYQSIGSGGGVQQLMSKTVDFGASDAFLSDEEMSKAPAKVFNIPTCLGCDVPTYNLEGNPVLKFTPDVLADIFMGKIKKWDDDRIKKSNPDAKLPSADISVVHRSDGSGTTYIWTDYLSKVSEDWKKSVGTGKSVNWPVGLGGKGNEGVGGLVKQTPNSIGYVELIYALQNSMSMGSVQNKKGNFIVPSLKSLSEAGNTTIPDDTRISITNTDADNGYPISSFTWILVYQNQDYNGRSEAKAKEVINLIWWMIHDGQKNNEALSYGILAPDVVKKGEAMLKAVTFGDKKILEN